MPRDTAPTHEADNQEQNDAATQAQTVADEARGRSSGDPSEDSEHGGSPDRTAITPDDAPDPYGADPEELDEAAPDRGAA